MTTRVNTDTPVAPVGAAGDHAGFLPPQERGRITVLPVVSTRRHRAVRGLDTPRAADAELSGVRPLGALVLADDRVHWRPVVDVTRLLVTAQVVAGAVIVADRLLRRPAAAKATVTMGPGGWVSMKGGTMAVRPSTRLWRGQSLLPRTKRPLWARLLAATALESLVS